MTLFRYFGCVATEVKGVVLPVGEEQLQFSIREPVGVVGAILPWNSPLMIAGMKNPRCSCRPGTLLSSRRRRTPRL